MSDGFLYPVPSAKPADSPLWVVGFNAAWLPILIDLVDNIETATVFDSPDDTIPGQVAELIKQLTQEVTTGTQIFPTSGMAFHDQSIIDNGNPITVAIDTASQYGWNGQQSAAAQFDAFHADMLLAAGTYTLHALHNKSATSGRVTWLVDGVAIASAEDFYNASTVRNVLTTITDVVVAADGLVSVGGEVLDKNASSGGYRAPITAYWMIRTGP